MSVHFTSTFFPVYDTDGRSFLLPTKMSQNIIFQMFLCETLRSFICLKLANHGHLQGGTYCEKLAAKPKRRYFMLIKQLGSVTHSYLETHKRS